MCAQLPFPTCTIRHGKICSQVYMTFDPTKYALFFPFKILFETYTKRKTNIFIFSLWETVTKSLSNEKGRVSSQWKISHSFI